MPWLQIKFATTPDLAPAVEDLLLDSGCASVTLLDTEDTPVYEPERGTTPLWQNTTVVGLYDADIPEQEIVAHVREHLELAEGQGFPAYRSEILEDKDWERAWMDHFHPLRFGSRLWVCPSWREVPDPEAVNLMLDPGLAFGTGTHPTTALCLEWLESLDLKGKTVIDYGCGSGILGIAAVLLGAEKMTGVDNDPQALIATRENAIRNNTTESCQDVYLPENFPEQQADVVVANILAGPLQTLAPQISACVRPGGLLAMSGLFERHVDALMLSYAPWIEFSPYTVQDGWVRLNGRRRTD